MTPDLIVLKGIQGRALLQVLVDAQRGRCSLCRENMDDSRRAHRKRSPRRPTIEHVVPTAHGGDFGRGNVLAAHDACNNAKGDRWPTPVELAFLAEINALLGWTKEKAA